MTADCISAINIFHVHTKTEGVIDKVVKFGASAIHPVACEIDNASVAWVFVGLDLHLSFLFLS